MLLLGLTSAAPRESELHEAGLLLRRTLLSRALGLSDDGLRPTPEGKPIFPPPAPAELSVSHSGQLAICALRAPGAPPPAVPPFPKAPLQLTPGTAPRLFLLPDCGAGSVGADAELLRPLAADFISRIARRFLRESPPAAETDRSRWLLRRWTELESRCKADGRGLSAVDTAAFMTGAGWSLSVRLGEETYALHVFAPLTDEKTGKQ